MTTLGTAPDGTATRRLTEDQRALAAGAAGLPLFLFRQLRGINLLSNEEADHLLDAATDVLLGCARAFDLARHDRFSAFAAMCIRRRLGHEITRTLERRGRRPGVFGLPKPSEGYDPDCRSPLTAVVAMAPEAFADTEDDGSLDAMRERWYGEAGLTALERESLRLRPCSVPLGPNHRQAKRQAALKLRRYIDSLAARDE